MPFDSLSVTNPVIEALRDGRARIERGWARFSLGSTTKPNGAVCALGGLFVESPTAPKFRLRSAGSSEAAQLLRVVLRVETNGDIALWNDSRNRTQADVLAVYDRAIERAVADELERIDAAI